MLVVDWLKVRIAMRADIRNRRTFEDDIIQVPQQFQTKIDKGQYTKCTNAGLSQKI